MRGAIAFAGALLAGGGAFAQPTATPRPAVPVILKPTPVPLRSLPIAPLAVNYDYSAVPEIAPPDRVGTVVAGNVSWSCDSAACRASGPWPQPSVSACASLAGLIGRIASYGRKGAELTADQLIECNASAPRPVAVGATTLIPPIRVGELSVIGGASGIVPAGPGTHTIAVTELSIVGGAITGATVGPSGTRTINVPELSVVGR